MARSEGTRRRLLVFGLLGLASAFAVAMVAVRMRHTGTDEYRNLVWNLVLAWVPFVIAVFVYDARRRGVSAWALAAPGAVWLLFLPNAPYLLTDFFLLRENGGVTVWFDIVLLSTFAWTGLLLGFGSLYLMQAVARSTFGAAAGWLLVFGALGLTSFGIYLGRVLRWNSWDFLVEPTALARDVWVRLSDPLAHPRTAAFTVLLAAFLLLGYLMLYSFARLVETGDDARSRR